MAARTRKSTCALPARNSNWSPLALSALALTEWLRRENGVSDETSGILRELRVAIDKVLAPPALTEEPAETQSQGEEFVAAPPAEPAEPPASARKRRRSASPRRASDVTTRLQRRGGRIEAGQLGEARGHRWHRVDAGVAVASVFVAVDAERRASVASHVDTMFGLMREYDHVASDSEFSDESESDDDDFYEDLPPEESARKRKRRKTEKLVRMGIEAFIDSPGVASRILHGDGFNRTRSGQVFGGARNEDDVRKKINFD